MPMPASPTSSRSSSSAGPSIGLALGGGGARGFAHIHVLAAFDDLGLRPAAIAGTSIGALFGAAAAAGLSASEIGERTLAALGSSREIWGRLWRLRPRRLSALFEAMPLFDAETTLGEFLPPELTDDFSDLKIPLRVVATDFYGGSEAAFSSGSLRRAVAASIALPVLFQPVEIDGRALVDGGLVNPLPFERMPVMTDLVVAVDVVGMPVRPDRRTGANMREALFGASQILMQTITREKLRAARPDVLIRPPVDRVALLDFLNVREILAATAGVREEAKRAIDRAVEGAISAAP